MIVFLLANTYIQNSIIDYLPLILRVNIKKTVVLNESCYSVLENKQLGLKQVIVNSIEDGITISDMTIIIPQRIPKTTIEYTIETCKKQRKKFILFPTEKIYNNLLYKPSRIAEYPESYVSQKPTILMVGFGKYAQITKFQLAINKFLTDRKYYFAQIFSDEFLTIFDKSFEERIVQDIIRKLFSSELKFDFSVITWPFDLFSSLELLGKYLPFLRPDYCIMCVENNFNRFDDLNYFCSVRFNTVIASYVKSNYVTVIKNDCKNYLYIPNVLEDMCEDINAVCFKAIGSITYPEGVKPIV